MKVITLVLLSSLFFANLPQANLSQQENINYKNIAAYSTKNHKNYTFKKDNDKKVRVAKNSKKTYRKYA